ncbi:DDE-type integrase/transposase/recombinase [Cumulibacter manganitolerans]|uniref:DDE-type integrase/transposase/recombinase n=1 Tax=Cumulibacter manganitolerans TaxID=1884992 RepID=UPI001886291B|nr:DDE-type integrase/transposase/recombinase [Cumulibacter manganitolerans]
MLGLQEAGFSLVRAVALVGYSRASWYRHQQPAGERAPITPHTERVQPHALSGAERAAVLAHLAREEFADLSVRQVFVRVLDEGIYLGSLRSWYRIARAAGASGDRRRLASHPSRAIPQLAADGPVQVWSWDITRIGCAGYRSALHLYVIEDVFSRKCVGWRLEPVEKDELAVALVADAITAHGAPHTLHADGGPSMTSGAMKTYLFEQHITHSRSRPRVSNDNPFSEALFKTVKYDLSYPERFEDLQQARAWFTGFFAVYNGQHRHSGLNDYTPDDVHNGTWRAIQIARQATLDAYYHAKPGRHRQPPRVQAPPGVVHINPPRPQPELSQAA